MASFPRGGSTGGSGKVGAKRSGDDNIFGTSNPRTKRIEVVQPKKKQKGGDIPASSAASVPTIGLGMTKSVDNKVTKIEAVTFNKLNTGCLVLGYVLQVASDRVIVSLPGSSTGMVAHHEVSDVLYKMGRESGPNKTKLPELSTLVSPMQMVRCYVLDQVAKSEGSATAKKVIRLSMRASLINRGLSMKHICAGFPLYGSVVSKEDHGYVVSAGISGANFFLPLKALPSNKADLVVGQPVETVCQEVNDGAHSATLRGHPKAVYEALTKSGNLAFNSLAPGMLVNVVVDKIVENGVTVSFLGIFYGVIDFHSLGRPYAATEWASTLKEGHTMHARLVLVDHGTKSIRLSVRPHVLEMRAPSNLPALGDKLEDLTVLTVQKAAGVLMARAADLAKHQEATAGDQADSAEGDNKKKKALAAAQKQQRDRDEEVLGVFVSKSSLAASLDPEEQASAEVIDADRIPKVYKAGGKVPSVRVKGYNLVEGWAIATNITDIVEGEVAHTSDVQVGQLQQVTVVAIKDFGLVVRLGSGKVTAVCPSFHTADVVVEGKLHKKFKVGQELNMRVWEVSSNGIIMTNKKTMVELPEAAAVTGYSGSETDLGSIVTGVVSKINLQGVHVRFFNKVRGIVPMSVLVAQGVVDPDEAYRAGQVLRAVVIGKTLPADGAETDAKANLYLALNMSKDVTSLLALMDAVAAPAGTITHTSSGPAAVGAKRTTTGQDVSASAAADGSSNELEFVSGSIYKFEDDVALVRLDSGKVARLQKHHLYDLAATGDALFNVSDSEVKVGMRVEDALVLSYHKGAPVITLKPLLLAVAKGEDAEVSIPSKVADMSPGQLVAGFVVKVDSFGVIVRFRGSLSALAPRSSIADRFVPTPVGLFTAGDSIRCVVQRVDLAAEKAIISFKPSLVAPSAGPTNYLTTLLREQHLAAQAASRSSKKLYPNWQKYAVGSVVKATVSALESYGVVLTGDDNTTMLLARHASPERTAELSVGKSVKVRVLDIDFANSVLEVSLDAAFTKTSDAAATPGKKDKKAAPAVAETQLEEGAKYDAVVGLVKDTHLVVLAKKTVIAYVMLADYNSPKPEAASYKVGQKISVRLQAKGGNNGAFPHAAVPVVTVFDESTARDASNRQARLAAGAGSSATGEDAPAEVLKQRFIEKLRVGQLLPWVVSEVTPTELKVQPERHAELGLNIKAVVHLSGAVDQFQSHDSVQKVLKKATEANREGVSALHPFHGLSAGGKVWCHVLQVRRESTAKANETVESFVVYLSLSVSAPLTALTKMNVTPAAQDSRPDLGKGEVYLPYHRMVQAHGKDELKCPSLHAAVVTKLEEVSCLVALSPYLSARLNYIDVSKDADVVELFVRKCFVGMRLVVAVTQVSKDNNRVKNVLVSRAAVESLVEDVDNLFDVTKSRNKLNDVSLADPEYEEGQLVNVLLNLHVARVPKLPAISVSLPGHKFGRVCATEIWDRDEWMDLSELHAQAQSHVAGSKEVLALPDGRTHGQVVQARVLSVTDGGIELSLRSSRVNTSKISAALKPDTAPAEGSVVSVYVSNSSTRGCFVRLTSAITGKVLMRDLSDDFVPKPEEAFPVGKLCQARLLSVSQVDSEAKLSLKESVVLGDKKAKEEIKKINVGDVVTGTVQRVTQDGVFVALQGTSLTGLSRRAAAITDAQKALSEEFEVGDVVRCKVLSVSKNSLKIGLGLRSQYFKKGANAEEAFDSDSEDEDEEVDGEGEGSDEEESDDGSEMDVEGEEEESGSDDGSDEDEECECSEEEGSDEDDVNSRIRVLDEGEEDSDDDSVEALIRQHALHSSGSEAEDSDEEEEEEEGSDSEESEEEAPVAKGKGSKAATTTAAKGKASKQADSSDEDSDDDAPASSVFKRATLGKGAKDVLGDLQWDNSAPLTGTVSGKKRPAESQTPAQVSDSESDSEGSDEEGGDGKGRGKLRTRQKEAARRKAEQEIRKREAALADGTLVPESKDDFERMLIAQPNSSFLWVQYMAHHLQSAAIDAARAVAARALRTIDYREEDEKYNVWIALLNMEHKYGSTETLEQAFARAVAESKGKLIYLAMAQTYEQSGDVAGAEAIYQKALKRPQYKKSKKVWMQYHQFKLRTGDAAAAKAQLARSMQSLSRHKHVEVISKYAMAEFDFGSAERGRVVFEELLTNYPKRTDLWHLYVDKEIKLGNVAQARQLFERMITTKASARNMKAVFKKYLAFETSHGSEESVEEVKQKARDYVSSMA